MKRIRMLLALLISAGILAVLPGCGQTASTTATPEKTTKAETAKATEGKSTEAAKTEVAEQTDPPSETEAAADEREHLEITVFFPMHPSASLDDVPAEGYMLDRMFGEKFNVTLDIQRVPATNAEENYNTMMASQDIPDVVKQGGWTSLNRYKQAWWPLRDFIVGKCPNLQKYFFDDPFIHALSADENGDVKILSMVSEQYIGDVLLVRGDLVEEWDIDIESYRTKEDIADLLRLVKGKDTDVLPYMTRMGTAGLTDRLCEGWSGIRQYEFVDTDDVVKYGAADERMKEVVEWLRGLYAEGLVDQEYPNTDTPKWQEQVLNQGVFLTHDNASSRIRWAQTEWAKLGVTGKYYQAIPPVQPDENTKGFTTIHYPAIRDAAAIYREASPEKVERILEMFEYALSEEGNILVNYGIEGVSFEYGEDGIIEDVAEYREQVDAGTMPQEDIVKGDFAQLIRLEPNGVYSAPNRPYQNVLAAAEMYEGGGLIRQNWINAIRFTNDEQSRITELSADIRTYTDENLDKFIMGISPMDEWDSYIDGFANIRLEEYLEIYNTAYQRARELVGN